MPKQKRALKVEALTYSDSFDSEVDQHFRGGPSHRAEDTGPYKVDKMVEEFAGQCIRSRQEFLQSPSGLSRRLTWASLCFKLESDVFVTVLAKGNSASRGHNPDDDFKVTVTAATPAKAAGTLKSLREQFLEDPAEEGASFFILTGRKVQNAPLEEKHRLSSQQLALLYGPEFVPWTAEFMSGLADPGISILRGETGTGKTSLIRHLMWSLTATHRFYFVPVDNFNLLSSGSLTNFWKVEQREHSSAVKVLVLEDAETLLTERGRDNRNPVSALLNLTDGLMSQFIKLHLICTLNCKMDDLDPALLRPGRLRYFKDFERIPRARALEIAQQNGLELPVKSDYTLAEIFSPANFSKNTAGAVKDKSRVGFGFAR